MPEVELLDGIEIFFDALKEKCSTAEEYAAELLKARGFLLEDDALILSDNSHKDDATYLNELLTADNLGEVRGDKIIINPGANVEKIFYKDNWIAFEVLCYSQSWERFVHNKFAPKIPVGYLEPFISRYVKAISACSVETYLSCDGNHPNAQKIQIWLTGAPNVVWHEIICRRLLYKKFKLRWNRGTSYDRFSIPFNKRDKWQTYIELNKAAEFLYNNRIKIRQIRREALDGITTSMARHFPDNVAQIFSERANKLFDNF